MAKPDIRSFKHIAVLQTAFLGDVVLALPLIQYIHDYCKTVELSLVTTPAASQFAACMKSLDNVISFDKRGYQNGQKGINVISEILRERKVDCIISLHRSVRSTIVTYKSKPKFSVGFNKSALAFLYKRKVKYWHNLHETDRNMQMLGAFSGFDVIPAPPAVTMSISFDDSNYLDSLLIGGKIRDCDKIVAIAPGSVWATKRWPPEYFAELIIKLADKGYKSVLIGGKEDAELCSGIASKTGALSLAGHVSIPQTLHLMTLCKLTITNDSAPTHFAGLMKCPALTIYGATSPIFGFAPTGNYDKVASLDSLKCKPCRIHGSDKCPIGTFECMMNLTPENVFNLAVEIMNNAEDHNAKN